MSVPNIQPTQAAPQAIPQAAPAQATATSLQPEAQTNATNNPSPTTNNETDILEMSAGKAALDLKTLVDGHTVEGEKYQQLLKDLLFEIGKVTAAPLKKLQNLDLESPEKVSKVAGEFKALAPEIASRYKTMNDKYGSFMSDLINKYLPTAISFLGNAFNAVTSFGNEAKPAKTAQAPVQQQPAPQAAPVTPN